MTNLYNLEIYIYMNTFSVFIFFGFRYVMYRKTKNLKDKIYIQVHMNAFSVFIYFWLSIRNVSENQKSERYIFWLENQKIIGNLWDVVLACFFAKNLSGSCVGFRRISSKNQKFRRKTKNFVGIRRMIFLDFSVSDVNFLLGS